MPVVFGRSSKIVSFKTNNVNAQILGFLLNVSSSYAKIRVIRNTSNILISKCILIF